MNIKKIIVKDTADWQSEKGLDDKLVNLLVELIQALGSKIEMSSHLDTLMVSPQ